MSLTKTTFSMIDGMVGNVNDYASLNDAIADNAWTFIPEGVVQISTAIDIPTGGKIVSATHSSQPVTTNRLEYTGDDSTTVVQMGTGTSLKNLTIADTSGGTNNTAYGIRSGSVGGLNLNCVSATGFRIGMNLTNAYYNTLSDVLCRNSTQVGFFQGTSVFHTSITNLTVNNIGGNVPLGIYITGSGGANTYINASMEGCDVGLHINQCSSVSFKDPYFEANGQSIYIGANAANVVIEGAFILDIADTTPTTLVEIASANVVEIKNTKWPATTNRKNRLLSYTGSLSTGGGDGGLVIGESWGSTSGSVRAQGALRNLIKMQPTLVTYGYLNLNKSAVSYESTDARAVTTTTDQALVRNPAEYTNQLYARVFLRAESQIVLSGGSIEIYAGYNTASNADVAYYYTTSNIPAGSNIPMYDPMTIAGDTNNIFSTTRLWLTGLNNSNTDETVLYWENTYSAPNRTINIYKSSAGGAGNLVATGTTSTAGALTLMLSEANSSGISGVCKLSATTTATTVGAGTTLTGNYQGSVGTNLATNSLVFGNTAGTSGQYRLMPVFTNY